MKKALLFSGALLALTSSMALAGAVNLSWIDCPGNTGSTNTRTITCASNAGSNVAAGSFTLNDPMADFVAVEIVLDLQAASATMPAWWDFNGCRNGSLSLTFDFSVFVNDNGACTDPFSAVGTGGLASYTVTGNRARAIGVGAIAAENAQSLSAGVAYYGFRMNVNNLKSTGAGNCAGCNTPVSIVLNSINAVGSSLGSSENNTTPSGSQCATLNGGTATMCQATPAQNKTWGQVKSLYR